MKQLILISLTGLISLACAGGAMAGNAPGTTRTLTGGIGLGSSHGRVPGSLPYNTTRAGKRSSRANSVLDGVNLDRYRGGISKRPAAPTGSAMTASGGSRPTSTPPTGIPAILPSQTGTNPPVTIGGRPTGTGGGYMPSVTPPTSIPATLPPQTGTNPPVTLGSSHAGTGGASLPSVTPPAGIPAILPAQTAGNPPLAIGRP